MVDMHIIPNFFIVGAPKCGTSALHQYLRFHPHICFSRPKEPSYFCTDFPDYGNVSSVHEYLLCFNHCRYPIKAAGEGTTWYLYSREAVQNILDFNAEAKFIVMMRNPVDLVYSLHGQLLFMMDEDIADFEAAWKLQDERTVGRHISQYCREPKFLQYREVGKVGAQLTRMLELVDSRRVKVILFDDFVSDTEKIYNEVLNFLDVQSDGRVDFPKINENKEYLNQHIARLLHRPPAGVIEASKILKKILKIGSFGIISELHNFNSRNIQRPALKPTFRRQLLDEFDEDITKIENLLERDLTHWRK